MRIFPRHIAVLFILLFFIPVSSEAQFRHNSSFGSYSAVHQPISKASRSLSLLQDTVTAPRSSRSPALATIFSAIVPGSGQIYAERYWTLPLIWGFGYWFVRQYIATDRKYDEWRVTYSERLASEVSGPNVDYAKYVRDFYRDQRDSFAFYLALTYVLNIVDAYVGASLYNFDVSEDLGGTSNVRFELRVPLQ